MNKYERAFGRLTERFKLNPSGWIPNIKPDGVYEMGTSFDNAEEFLSQKGTEIPIESFSIYNVFWTICYTRRKRRLGEAFQWGMEKSKWESLWSFLSDVNLGVYDTTNWVPVDEWLSTE